MELRPVPFAEAASLVDAQIAELSARYGEEGASPVDGADFDPPHGAFLVARVGGVDVGCGGLRPLSAEVGEVKRMYADPMVRGQGVGRALLRALLDHARAVGLREVWLETGVRQPEAMALYVSEGFAPIEPYGHYKDHPESRCYRLPFDA